jgi:HK97 family phage major capsid protein
MATARKISSTQTRTFELDRAAVDKDKRTIELSFSSEHPVERWFGVEILDHDSKSVDLSRLNSGAPLLVNHDTRQQCGVVESAEVRDKKGFAKVRFGQSAFGEEIFKDVQDGIRRLVSVGYRLMDNKLVEQSEVEGKETYRFKRWQPYEVSIVPVPADPTVGVGRGAEENNENDFELPMKRNLLLTPDAPAGGGAAAAPVVDSPELVAKRNKERTTEILKIAEQYRERISDAYALATTAIDKEQSPSDFARFVIMPKLSTPPIAGGSEPVERGEGTSTSSTGGQPNGKTETRTLGELITTHEEYRKLAKKGAASLKDAKFNRALEFPDANVRATLTTTVAGLTKYERPPGIVMVEQQELTIADLLAPGETENTTIRFMQEDTYTNAATALAEEGTYAEASWDLSEVDSPIKKIGVIGRVTEEIFADSAAITSYVNARLPFMVREREELHLLSGTGANNQITGLLTTTGIQTLSAAAYNSVVTAIHKAITKVRVVGRYQPTAIVLNPYDWENIKLMQDANGQYIAGGPFYAPYGNGGYSNVMMLWGLPCISTTNQAQGTALVGAFRLGAQLWRRRGLTIETTNTDASDFANDRIAIKVSERLGLTVYRPLAFCTVTAIPA